MKRVVTSALLPQDICIFCATRLQNASAKPPRHLQRRLFGSTHALRNPPVGAAAGVKKQDAEDNGWVSWSPAVKIDQPRSTDEKNAPNANWTNQGKFDGANSWRGLKRRTPDIDRWEDNGNARPQNAAWSDNTYKSEEQRRRLEDSKQSDYVELGRLHRRNRWPQQDDQYQATPLVRRLDLGANVTPEREGRENEDFDARFGNSAGSPRFLSGARFDRHPRSDSDYLVRSGSASTRIPMSNGNQRPRWRTSTGNSEPSSGTDRTNISFVYDGQQHRLPKREFKRQPPQEEIVAPSRPIERLLDRERKPTVNQRRQQRTPTERRRSSRAEEDDMDDEEFAEKRAARKRKMERKGKAKPIPIFLPEFIRVSNLVVAVKARPAELLEKMEQLGFEGVTHDHVLDAETAGLVAAEYNFEPIVEKTQEQDLEAQPPIEDKSSLPTRPPVVTIMGHVDHGKTTLLDFLRKSSVAASEHGGITQHIGAFSVPMSGGRLVTFLDTPGHAAFLAMRQRGANVTDIVILVVAADDSVMAQTIEAVKHAQAARVPIIVAVNKIDKEDARPDQVKQDLARHGIEIEDYGGDTQVVCVSGKTGQGMAQLEDAVVALADILDMRAPTEGLVEGWVLEGSSNKAGRVATILVRRGTLHPGDVIVAGTSWARVRSLRNEANVLVLSAGPGTPVAVDGWREQPTAGDEVLQSPNNSEQQAKSVIEHRLAAFEQEQLAKDITVVNEARQIAHERHLVEKAKKLAEKQAKRALRRAINYGESIESTEAEDLDAAATSNEGGKESTDALQQETFFILKADVSGSVEAVANSVTSLGNSEIHAVILRSGVGPITEFDIEHAAAAQGHIINFNTPVDNQMARLAEESGVQILDQSIIYRLIDQVRGVLADKLPKLVTKRVVGEAEIAQVFDYNVRGRQRVPVAGCRVRNGEIGRKAKIRVMREGKEVYDGTLASLKHVKKDIVEARKGTECGMGFENWTLFQPGDQVQAYEEIIESRTL